jgi:hypothetical protein
MGFEGGWPGEIRCEKARQVLAHPCTPALHALLKPAEHLVQVAFFFTLLFRGIQRLSKRFSQPLNQGPEKWHLRRAGDARPTEKQHPAFLMAMEERLRDVWAVGDELHGDGRPSSNLDKIYSSS